MDHHSKSLHELATLAVNVARWDTNQQLRKALVDFVPEYIQEKYDEFLPMDYNWSHFEEWISRLGYCREKHLVIFAPFGPRDQTAREILDQQTWEDTLSNISRKRIKIPDHTDLFFLVVPRKISQPESPSLRDKILEAEGDNSTPETRLVPRIMYTLSEEIPEREEPQLSEDEDLLTAPKAPWFQDCLPEAFWSDIEIEVEEFEESPGDEEIVTNNEEVPETAVSRDENANDGFIGADSWGSVTAYSEEEPDAGETFTDPYAFSNPSRRKFHPRYSQSTQIQSSASHLNHPNRPSKPHHCPFLNQDPDPNLSVDTYLGSYNTGNTPGGWHVCLDFFNINPAEFQRCEAISAASAAKYGSGSGSEARKRVPIKKLADLSVGLFDYQLNGRGCRPYLEIADYRRLNRIFWHTMVRRLGIDEFQGRNLTDIGPLKVNITDHQLPLSLQDFLQSLANVLVVPVALAGTALNLQRARYLTIIGPVWTKTEIQQGDYRIHRVGQRQETMLGCRRDRIVLGQGGI
ncbi:hypothetical protein VTI74DRAFT_1882 [Chaetomium olivicolor]